MPFFVFLERGIMGMKMHRAGQCSPNGLLSAAAKAAMAQTASAAQDRATSLFVATTGRSMLPKNSHRCGLRARAGAY